MKTYYECIPCLLQSIIRLFKNNLIPIDKHKIIIKRILEDLSKKIFSYSPPNIAQRMYKIIKNETGVEDLFKEIKYEYNKICMELYEKLKNRVNCNKNPLYESLKLSIIGNIIDFAPNFTFNLMDTISKFEDRDFAIDKSSLLFDDINNANKILFIGDNCGEIVFDKLFIEIINHRNIIYAVRGKPILNDSTQEDADFVSMTNVAKVIDTGTDIPGVDFGQSSSDFIINYRTADFIISKGQGNYESLCEIDNKKIYFLLMAKCDLVAKQLGVKKGDLIVMSNKNIRRT